MMFGYACDETPELMPLPISLAHKLARRLAEVRKSGEMDYLRPDGKSQVTVDYDGDRPVRVDTVVISTQHREDVQMDALRADVMEKVIRAVIPAQLLDEDTKYFINPTAGSSSAAPQGDSGLTGRKIIVDTYGGYARHGGGAFSGKDPSKVDRSAAYAAPLGGQEHRGRGPGPPLRGAAGLRHRRGAPRLDHGGHLRHRRHRR